MAKLKLKARSSRRKRIILIACIALVLVLAIGAVAAVLLTQNKNPSEHIDHIVVSTTGKTKYFVEEKFDNTGLSVQVILNNGSYYFVSADELTVEGFDSSKVNDKLRIKVTYKGFSDYFTVQVKSLFDPKPVVQYIEVKGYKETYTWAEWQSNWIDLNGMYVELHYTDGSTYKVFVNSTHNIEGLGDINAPGRHQLTVYYNDVENVNLLSDTFTIIVTE